MKTIIIYIFFILLFLTNCGEKLINPRDSTSKFNYLKKIALLDSSGNWNTLFSYYDFYMATNLFFNHKSLENVSIQAIQIGADRLGPEQLHWEILVTYPDSGKILLNTNMDFNTLGFDTSQFSFTPFIYKFSNTLRIKISEKTTGRNIIDAEW